MLKTWGNGKPDGRGVYAQWYKLGEVPGEPRGHERVFLGLMDSAELATEVCEAHNARLRAGARADA